MGCFALLCGVEPPYGGVSPPVLLSAPQCCPQPPSVALSPPALPSAPQRCSQPPALLSAPQRCSQPHTAFLWAPISAPGLHPVPAAPRAPRPLWVLCPFLGSSLGRPPLHGGQGGPILSLCGCETPYPPSSPHPRLLSRLWGSMGTPLLLVTLGCPNAPRHHHHGGPRTQMQADSVECRATLTPKLNP